MILKNQKKKYQEMYPNLELFQVELEISKFDKFMQDSGISIESSNRHKYLRGWLMRANLVKKDQLEKQ